MHQTRKLIFRFATLMGTIGALSFSLNAQVVFEDASDSRGIFPNVVDTGFGSGVAAFDFDEDGDIDLFLPQKLDSPDRLYINDGEGNFLDIGKSSGIDVMEAGRSAMWIDFDDDHLVDLLIASDCFNSTDPGCADKTALRMYRQTAPGKFSDVTDSVGLNTLDFEGFYGHRSGICCGDIDRDGDLDILAGQWDGGINLLVNHDGVYVKETEQRGLGTKKLPGQSDPWQSVMHDFNGDGWIDIFTAVDFSENHLWINQQDGTFVDEAASAGVDFAFNEMGVTVGDYDNDGDFDIYVTNIFEADKYNLLLRNESTVDLVQFTEVAAEAGVDDTGFGWGTTFFDANNDTLLDLAATNGWFNGVGFEDQSRLFLQSSTNPGSFQDISVSSGFDDQLFGSCLISADLNRDGDLDLLQVCNPALFEGPFRVLENQLNETVTSNWLVIRPRQAGKNHWCIGASVTVEIGDLTMTRPILSTTSMHGQEPAEAFFGLGENQTVDRVIVTWPLGDQSVWENIGGNQIFDARDADIDLDGDVTLLDVRPFVEDFGPCGDSCQSDLNHDGTVDTLDVQLFISSLIGR